MAEKEYRRLTRAHTSPGIVFAGRSSLWLGSDHVLCIETSGYVENYKRFYFRDIQAIVARRTNRRLWWNLVLGSFAVLFAFIAVFGSLGNPTDERIIWLSILGTLFTFCAILMLINTLKGPACVCYLRTAVQIEELPSLARLPRLNRVLGEIRPLIAQAQGELAAAEIPARMRQLAESPAQNYVVDDPNLPPRML